MIFNPSTIAPLALALAGLSAVDARAVEPTYVMRLHYYQGELASPAGARALYERIGRKARRTCQIADLSVAARTNAQRCRAELIDRAIARIDSPLLAAEHGQPLRLASSR
jgi:UrcA family protein